MEEFGFLFISTSGHTDRCAPAPPPLCYFFNAKTFAPLSVSPRHQHHQTASATTTATTTTKKLNCENISSHLIRTVANSVVNSTKKELQRSNRCAALCNLLLQYYLFLLHKNFDLGGAACRRDFVSSNKISGSNNRANQNVSEFGAGYFAKI